MNPQDPTIPVRVEPGDFELGESLGHGGMAVVYRARDRKLDREVAIKELSEETAQSERLVRMFLEEAKKMAAVDHPNVLPIHAVVDDGQGRPRLVMELAESSLADHLRSEPLDPAEVRKIARHLLAGLQAIHDAGLVHRDLKPANVFYRRGQYKIGDFGIATAGEEQTQLFATPRYMAPEVLTRPNLIGPTSDLYSLGLVLYESAVGRRTFEKAMARSVDEITAGARDVAEDRDATDGRTWQTFHASDVELPPAHRVDARVPEDLSRLIAQLLRKNLQERIRTCRQALDLLEGGAVGAGAVPPAPPSPNGGAISGAGATQIVNPSQQKTPQRTGLLVAVVVVSLLACLVILLLARGGAPVRIISEPSGASIFIDGNNVGVTPEEQRLASDAAVELRLGGYETAELGPDDAVDGLLGGPLQWAEPVLVDSKPAGAAVLRGKELLGETPLEFRGEGSSVELELRLKGYPSAHLEVEAGDTSVMAPFERELPEPPESMVSAADLVEALEPFLTPHSGVLLKTAPGTRNPLRFGDTLRFEARVPDDAGAALFMIFSNGDGALLYPTVDRETLELRAERTGSTRTVVASEPAGVDRAYLLTVPVAEVPDGLPSPPRGDTADWLRYYPWDPPAGVASSRDLVRWAAGLRKDLGPDSSLVMTEVVVTDR